MSMRCSAILVVHSFICFLVFLNAAHVESRSSHAFHWYNGFFVFGDSFADTGNSPKSDLSEVTRQWYKPYGASHGFLRDPNGRFSNSLVQSDFVARILGRGAQAPQTYRRIKAGYQDKFGVNFAVAGAGVFEVPREAPTLAKQIDNFKEMLDDGTIGKWQLRRDSVALVAISGNDYERVANMSSVADVIALMGNVTDEIARGVDRLRKLGVKKVLVNTLHPLACTPWQSRPSNYTKCVGRGNMAADFHNDGLRQKLLKNGTASDSVFLIDLNKAFTAIINPSDSGTVAKHFKEKLKPCCDSCDPSGYCGQVDEDGGAKYSVCSNPEKHFFWDDVHPTHAGWKAVMELLEGDIKDFLQIYY